MKFKYIHENFNGQISVKIETHRLFIHSYDDNDFENCLSLYGDEKLTRFFDYGKPKSRCEVESLIKQKCKYFIRGKPYGLFSIFDKKNMIFVGQVDLIPTEEQGTLEWGIILRKQYHNRGYAFEIGKAILDDYVKELNLWYIKTYNFPIHKVIATVHPKNYSSQRLSTKLGMSFYKEEQRFGGNLRLWYSLSI